MDKIDIAATMEGDSQVSEASGPVSGRGAATTSGPLTAATVIQQHTKLIPGSVIPGTRLKVVRWLGQGGVGVVFEVRHLDIERRYAAKLLNLARNPQRTQRFREEARTISQLGSAYIVEVFDFQELPDGRLMFVMELVEGQSLSSECRDRGPVELARLLGLMRQVCKGLGDAHDKGFLHRDVKPDNIMVGRGPDGREQVKLVDFGLATLQGSRRNRNRGGTPAYMSPEQCRGLDLDVRTDVYSLGIALYELGCGRLPFDGIEEQVIRRQHLDETPVAPSARGEHELPSQFDALVLRCMAKFPHERYASMAEVEAALIELQLDLGLRTRWDDLPVPKLEDERRWRQLDDGLAALREQDERRRRRRVLGLVGVLALTGIGAALGLKAQHDARAQLEARDRGLLDELRERAIVAGSRARWVYPNANDDDRETAYRVILEIEELTIDESGDVAYELRAEFANTLVGLGDNYWKIDGGKTFAAEFYLQALVFMPDDERANERAGMTPGQLEGFFTRAASGAFDRNHLRVAESITALAAASPEQIDGSIEELLESEETPASLRDNLARVKRSLEQEAVREEFASSGGGSEAGGETGGSETGGSETGGSETGGDETGGSETGGADTEGGAGSAVSGESSSFDKQASRDLSSSADAAYNSGKTKSAERLYRQALAKYSRNVDALVGLHNIHFDRGDYRQALKYVERAVSVRPKQGSLRIYAGDACMKVLDYKCARKHYTEAKSLGVGKASKRLERLAEQSGAN